MIVIILKRKVSAEADLALSVYSREEGLLELRARGAAKASSKLAGHLEPLSLVDIEVLSGKILGAVGENMYAGIKADYDKLNYAGKAVGLFLSKLRAGDSEPAWFDFLAAFLDFMDQTKGGEELLYNAWCLKLPYIMGWDFAYGTDSNFVAKVIASPWSEVLSLDGTRLASLGEKALSLWEY